MSQNNSGLFSGKIVLLKNLADEVINAFQAALGFTPENIANKGQPSGYADLDAGGLLPAARLTLARLVTVLGFTPENSANKNVNSGYAGLDASSNLVGNLATKPIDNTTIPTDGMVLTYDNASGKVKFKTAGSGSLSEVQFLASQAALGNLIMVDGNRSAAGVIVAYTVPNAKTFTLYQASFSGIIANTGTANGFGQLRNNGTVQASVMAASAAVAISQVVIEAAFPTKGDQLAGNGVNTYDVNYSGGNANDKESASICGYIA